MYESLRVRTSIVSVPLHILCECIECARTLKYIYNVHKYEIGFYEEDNNALNE